MYRPFQGRKPALLYKLAPEELPDYNTLKPCKVIDYTPEWVRWEEEKAKAAPPPTAAPESAEPRPEPTARKEPAPPPKEQKPPSSPDGGPAGLSLEYLSGTTLEAEEDEISAGTLLEYEDDDDPPGR